MGLLWRFSRSAGVVERDVMDFFEEVYEHFFEEVYEHCTFEKSLNASFLLSFLIRSMLRTSRNSILLILLGACISC
jgi:hypothetical protein